MQTENSILMLDINLLIPNKYQPRKVFDDNKINSLAESIKTYGIISPILVRKSNDKYEIIAGERRFRAAKKLGLNEVPVIIKTANEQEMAELALIENLERQELSPIEEAKSYEEIMKIGNYTQLSLANKLGKSQSTIANKIRLLSLPTEVQDALAHKKISERHARSLISVQDEDKQIELLNQIITEKLTVKETEQIIKNTNTTINEQEIKQAISDIMKSLNISEDEKEEKEDDNMNNGNFFPNFDNNANNNASLNMMNMQSMNQQPMEPVQEMVMPTMTPTIPEPQLFVPNQTVEIQQPSFQADQQMMTPPQMGMPEMNNNPFGNMLNQQDNNNVTESQPMPTPINNDNSFFVQQPVQPEAPMAPPMMDAPLFNPEMVMPTPEPQMVAPNPYEIPVMPMEAPLNMQTPSLDRLTELQNLLQNNGYNYKLYSNDTENCVIIELQKN